MKKRILFLAFAGLAPSAFAQFQVGQLAVTVVGDGSGALGSGATQTKILSVDKTSGASTVAATLNGGSSGIRLTNSGSATSEGALQISGNGQFLTLAGYDAAAGTAGVVGTASAATNRVIGRVDFNGTVSYTANSTIDDKNNVRGAWTDTGTDFYSSGTGTNGGVNYISGGSATLVSTGLLNTRVVAGYGGDLYCTASSGAFLGLNKISGLPTGASTVTNMINAGAGSSSYGFWFANATTAYIADDRAVSSGGGIQKWTFSGSSWSLAYTLGTGASSTVGARGLVGEVNGSGGVDLYATTADTISASAGNRIIKVTDLGAGSVASTVATAAGNTAYRGVALAPTVVPEPASMIALGLGIAGLVSKKRRK